MMDITGSHLVDITLEKDGTLYVLLNKNLTVPQLAALTRVFEVIDVKYNDTVRFALIYGRYKRPEGPIKGMILDPAGNLSEAETG